MSFHKSFDADTSDATALQHHIKSGKTAYIATGKVTGNAYTPALMKYNGTTGSYLKSHTNSGNLVTVICRIAAATLAGTSSRYIIRINGVSSFVRASLLILDSTHTDTTARNKLRFRCVSSANVALVDIITTSDITDGLPHTVFAAFNSTTGAATFVVDGIAVDDTGWANRVAPTTGTLEAGTGDCVVGAASATPTNPYDGQIGFFGYRDAYLTNWSDFMRSDGSPIAQAESGAWGGWGAQPLFWNEHGQMDNNLGSAGNMTRNGTIVVGKGGT